MNGGVGWVAGEVFFFFFGGGGGSRKEGVAGGCLISPIRNKNNNKTTISLRQLANLCEGPKIMNTVLVGTGQLVITPGKPSRIPPWSPLSDNKCTTTGHTLDDRLSMCWPELQYQVLTV